MLKSDIIWPESCRYKTHSEWEPIGFFSDCLCNSTSFDLMLGFFSTSAINVLSDGFAAFLYSGGRMRLIINDILSDEDRVAIATGSNSDIPLEYFDLSNIKQITETLSERNKHFFDCLSWLIRNERLEIRIVRPAQGTGIAHTKCGTFSDGVNTVGFEGSVNFSYSALIQNMESMTIACDWNGKTDGARIKDIQKTFDETFSGENPEVVFVEADDLKAQISKSFPPKEILELLEDEVALMNQRDFSQLSITVMNALNKAKNKVKLAIERTLRPVVVPEESTPHFPYPSGPRPYQVEAYENWKNNKQKGLFAMATGTGKTLTALNCLLNIYQKFRFYKAIILVPTLTLVDQWEEECRKFDFTRIVKVCSKNKDWKSELDAVKFSEEVSAINGDPSYIIISTYSSFAREAIFHELCGFNPKATKQILLIADEAHNMGAGRILDRLDGVKFLRRIGLSATPERQFDEAGNREMMNFFGCSGDKYTFEFSMREAIDQGFLCRYYYFPHVVRLTDLEMAEYIKISNQLVKFFNYDTESFPKAGDILSLLLLKRKRIIHKAENKVEIFKEIVRDRYKEMGNLKYTLIYVPEGAKPDNETADVFDDRDSVPTDEDTDHLIDLYTQIVQEISPTTTVRKFTSGTTERNQLLSDFASGDLEVLTSMKCLDEGVDVPRSELAIFCASTGNPRQFIQRRGRILRKHPDKHHAIIHDLVVVPEINAETANFAMEKSLLRSELKRVRDFANLSENADVTYEILNPIVSNYNLPIF